MPNFSLKFLCFHLLDVTKDVYLIHDILFIRVWSRCTMARLCHSSGCDQNVLRFEANLLLAGHEEGYKWICG